MQQENGYIKQNQFVDMMKTLITTKLLNQYLGMEIAKVTLSDEVCLGLSIEMRKSGTASWRLRYSRNGVQKLITLGAYPEISIEKARSIALESKNQIRAGNISLLTARHGKKCPLLEDFIKGCYLPHVNSYKRNIISDLSMIKNHLIPFFGSRRMNEIESKDISDFMAKKIVVYKPSYCNRMLVLLCHIFNVGISLKVYGVVSNPANNVKAVKVNQLHQRYLSKDESIKLMMAVNASQNCILKYFVTLALLTGARKSELLNAKWEHVDFVNRKILFPITKSGRPRIAPLTDRAMEVIELLSREVAVSRVDTEWLFPNPKTGKPFRSIFNAWNTARKIAGLEDLRVHDLRHSFASALVNSGVPIYDVQKLLGHQNVKTTERYSHLSDERLRKSSAEATNYYQEMLL